MTHRIWPPTSGLAKLGTGVWMRQWGIRFREFGRHVVATFAAAGICVVGTATASGQGIFEGQSDIGDVTPPGTGSYSAAGRLHPDLRGFQHVVSRR